MVSGMAPDISVVIVSYKVPALLRACLASLQRETGLYVYAQSLSSVSACR